MKEQILSIYKGMNVTISFDPIELNIEDYIDGIIEVANFFNITDPHEAIHTWALDVVPGIDPDFNISFDENN